MRLLRLLAAALGLAVLSGCVETNDEFVLNPDGSGKVQHTAVFQPMDFSEEKPSAADQLKNAAQAELEKAEGVDTWRDVTCERGSDGRIRFAGTAYFRNASKLKFHNNGLKQALLAPKWQDNTLELLSEKKEKPAAAKPVPPTDEAVTKAVTAARAQYQQMKPMMATMLGTMKQEFTFRLPGKVTASSNLRQGDDGALRIEMSGAKMLAAMDQMLADDAKMREAIKAGKDPMKDGPEDGNDLNKELFGEAKPVRAVVAPGGKAQFDYTAEVTAAKAAMPALLKKLGVAAPVVVAPAGSSALKSVTVAGVRWIRFVDDKRDLRPFNWPAGYTLSVIVEFPGSVLSVKGGKVEKAEATDGTDLLPKREFDRQLEFPHLSKDKTAAVFGLRLAPPADDVNGFKEITGQISYLVAEKTKKVDLGFAKLAAGETGKELGATIKGIKASRWDKERTEIEVKFAGGADSIKAVELLSATGESLEVGQNGHSQMGNQTTLTLAVKGAVPADGKLVFEVWEGLQQFDATFTLKNITLTGTPMP